MNQAAPQALMAAALCLSCSASEAAEVEGQVGVRQYQLTETAANGRSLVRESGALPTLGARWSSALGTQWSSTSLIELGYGAVTYDGQSQSGVPVGSRSGIDTVAASSLLHCHLPWTGWSWVVGGELEWFRRHIRSQGAYTGLDERSSQGRGLLGLAWQGPQDVWRVTRRLGVSSQVTVRSDGGVFDRVTLPGGRATGWLLEWEHALSPQWRIGAQADRVDTRASESRTLTLNGQAIGSVVAPRWRRDQFTLLLRLRLD